MPDQNASGIFRPARIIMSQEQRTLPRAKSKIFHLLRIRYRSEKEIHDYLSRKKFSEDITVQTVDYFKKLGLIDDKAFTQKWISSRLNKPYGINRIRFELRLKGIKPSLLEEELKNIFDSYDASETVATLAQKQAAKYQDTDKQKVRQRVYGYLLRRGFNQETIIQAVKKI